MLYNITMNREEAEIIEKNYVEKQISLTPNLFAPQSVIENSEYLQNFGIFIPEKHEFPIGKIKTIYSDFIVEEVLSGNIVKSIDINNKKIESKKEEIYTSVYATLVKCGLSTIEVVEELSKELNIPKENIGYGGIKDKNAITAQEISIKGVAPEILNNISNKSFFLKDVHTGKGFIQKGQLEKNKFTILIRSDLDQKEQVDILSKKLETVFNEGFYNYYYLQRFGSPRFIAFILGSHILSGKYQEAVECLLSEDTPRELPFFKNLRKEIKNKLGKWQEIRELIAQLPVSFRNELSVVDWLCKNPDDYLGALLSIPDQIMLWVYSVSSILFNDKISTFIQRNENVPRQLPLLLSDDRKDIEFYKKELQSIGLYPFTRNYIKPFKNIIFKKRLVNTKVYAELHGAKIVDEGLILSFSLSKGEYATTLLSNLFNLSYGQQDDLDIKILDLKSNLGLEPINSLLEKFNDKILLEIRQKKSVSPEQD